MSLDAKKYFFLTFKLPILIFAGLMLLFGYLFAPNGQGFLPAVHGGRGGAVSAGYGCPSRYAPQPFYVPQQQRFYSQVSQVRPEEDPLFLGICEEIFTALENLAGDYQHFSGGVGAVVVNLGSGEWQSLARLVEHRNYLENAVLYEFKKIAALLRSEEKTFDQFKDFYNYCFDALNKCYFLSNEFGRAWNSQIARTGFSLLGKSFGNKTTAEICKESLTQRAISFMSSGNLSALAYNSTVTKQTLETAFDAIVAQRRLATAPAASASTAPQMGQPAVQVPRGRISFNVNCDYMNDSAPADFVKDMCEYRLEILNDISYAENPAEEFSFYMQRLRNDISDPATGPLTREFLKFFLLELATLARQQST